MCYAMAVKILAARYVKGVVKPEAEEGEHVPEICFIGRSNVGKSSMINRLAGQKVARTSATPGATRIINLYGIEYESGGRRRSAVLSDFPGFGYAKVPRDMSLGWKEMIEGYITGNERITTIVWVYDVRRDLDELDGYLIEWLGEIGLDFILVLTKTDKGKKSATARKKAAMTDFFDKDRIFVFSAKSGDGRKELLARLFDARLPP